MTKKSLRPQLDYLLACLLAAVLPFGTAQSQNLTPEQQDIVNGVIGQAVNAITVFSSQPTVSTGSFKIDRTAEPDAHFDVIRFPFSIDLAEPAEFTPFVDGGVGMFKAIEHFPALEGGGEDDFSAIETTSAGLGGGFRWTPNEGVIVTPEFSAYYSHTSNHYDYNNQFSQEVYLPLGKEIFGWEVDTITYVPTIRIDYNPKVAFLTVNLWSKYSYLYNDSISTDSSTIDISSDSGLWQNSIGETIPLDASIRENPLFVHWAFTRTDIYGDGKVDLEFDNFYEASVELFADVADRLGPLRRLGLVLGHTFGHDLSGWRIGGTYDF